MALSTGLAAYYKLDEVSGTRVDSVGTNHLTDNNTVTSQPGIIGTAAEFLTANNEYLQCADAPAFGFTTQMTVAAWVFETNQAAGDMTMISKWTYSSNGGWVIQNGTPSRADLSIFIATTLSDGGTGCNMLFNDADIPANTWAHVVMVFDGTQTGDANRLKIYVNGVAKTLTVNNGAVPAALQNDTAPFVIGQWPGLGRYYTGRIDEVGLWNRALTPAEVTQLYNGGAGMSYDQILSSAGGGGAFHDQTPEVAAHLILTE